MDCGFHNVVVYDISCCLQTRKEVNEKIYNNYFNMFDSSLYFILIDISKRCKSDLAITSLKPKSLGARFRKRHKFVDVPNPDYLMYVKMIRWCILHLKKQSE